MLVKYILCTDLTFLNRKNGNQAFNSITIPDLELPTKPQELGSSIFFRLQESLENRMQSDNSPDDLNQHIFG